MLLTILAFIVVIGVLITIHEFGHFAVAKLLKIRVLVFSLGFGPKIFSWKSKETEYRLSAIPLGGYVKMAGQEAIMEGKPVEEGDFYSRGPFKRILVVLAGPLMNLILAFLIFFSVSVIGYEQLVFEPIVGGVIEKMEVEGEKVVSPASKSGLQEGDRFIEIKGEEVKYWSDLQEIVFNSEGEEITFAVERGEETISMEMKPLYDEENKTWMIGVYPRQDNVVSLVIPDSPADKAGLKEGDEIIYLNQEKTDNWNEIKSAFEQSDVAVNLTVERNGENELIEIEKSKEMKDILQLGFITGMKKVKLRKPPQKAVVSSFNQTNFMVYNTFKGIIFLIAGKISPKEALGGPITIADFAGKSMRSGWHSFLNYIAILSIVLFVINLFPIPVLDGGNILLFIIEAFKRSPVSVKFRIVFQYIGLVLLLGVMVFAIMMDVVRYVF